jgi:hypothetical protein
VGNDLVYLATASSQTEASTLRAYLEAHGVHAHVQGEHHSSLLGPLGGFAIELRILVPDRDLDTARELLEAFHAAEPLDEDIDVGEPEPGEGDDESASDESPPTSPGRAAALALVPGFGLGHVVTGAPGRGLALMALEVVGIMYLVGGDLSRGLAAIVAAIALDVFGATKRARDRAAFAMPSARLHSGDRDSGPQA